MNIKPIKSEDDYEEALKDIEQLMDKKSLSPSERDRLDVLSALVDVYEDEHDPIPLPDDPVEVLLHFMQARSLRQVDLIPYMGSKERVSEVLNRKRGLSLMMIRKLHNGLGIPAELLIGKTESDSSESDLLNKKITTNTSHR